MDTENIMEREKHKKITKNGIGENDPKLKYIIQIVEAVVMNTITMMMDD